MVTADAAETTALNVEPPMAVESRRREAHDSLNSDSELQDGSHLELQDLAVDAPNRPASPGLGAQSLLLAKKESHGPPSDPPGHSPARWGIHWQHPVLPLCLFAGSLLLAIGHDYFYSTLDGKLESTFPQKWALRVGNGLALAHKTGLVAILALVNTQLIWATLRRKFMALQDIDGMFRLMGSPTALLNRHLWVQAKTLLVLAGIAWLMPLIAVVTPATLSVTSSVRSYGMQFPVPTVKFDTAKSWGTYGFNGIAITGASSEISRLLSAVASSVSYIPSTAPFPNSSYDLSFWAPSYKCVNLSEAVAEQSAHPPQGRENYYNYSRIQAYWDAEAKLQGKARIEDGNAYLALVPNSSLNAIFIRSGAYFWTAPGPSPYVALVCQLYNTSYDVSVQFENGIQSITPRSIRYLQLQKFVDTGLESVTKVDYDPAVMAAQTENTALTASWVTHLLFRDFLVGNLTLRGDGALGVSKTSLMRSALADCDEMGAAINGSVWTLIIGDSTPKPKTPTPYSNYQPGLCRNTTLARAIEDLSRNFTYSLMAASYNFSRFTDQVLVNVASPRNFYAYERLTLITAYLASLSVVLLWMGVGTMALWRNGIASSANFSALLCTTRNPDLDALARGHSLGADPLPDDIARVKLKFGRLHVGGGEPAVHAAFGLQGTVTTVNKGDKLL